MQIQHVAFCWSCKYTNNQHIKRFVGLLVAFSRKTLNDFITYEK